MTAKTPKTGTEAAPRPRGLLYTDTETTNEGGREDNGASGTGSSTGGVSKVNK